MLTAKNLERLIELENKLRAEYQVQLDAKSAEIDAKSAEIESGLQKQEEQKAVIAKQLEHSLQGAPSAWRFSQFNDLARIRAVLVFPVPRGPVNK